MMFFAGAFTVVGGLAVGAYLIVNGHPWFGGFAMLIGACVSMRHTTDDQTDKPDATGKPNGE
jgi:hypothetical protein